MGSKYALDGHQSQANSSADQQGSPSNVIPLQVLSPLARAAVEYAGTGLPLIPCWPGSKKPRVPWQDGRLRTVEEVAAWWQQYPNDNIAIVPADRASHDYDGWMVIDLDNKAAANGLATWQRLQDQHGQAPDTFTVRTPSGGQHLYFTTDQRFGNGKPRDWQGIDVRSVNGYVLIAPSVIDARETPDTAKHGTYTVLNEVPAAELPEWIPGLLSSEKKEPGAAATQLVELDLPVNVERAKTLLRHAPLAREGNGSDDATYKLAACICRDLAISPGMAFEIMWPWAEKCGFEADWLEQKIANAASYGENDIGKHSAPDMATVPAVQAYMEARAAEEPEPFDIFGTITPEPVLTRDMLPTAIADYAFDAAERIGVDPAMVACPALVASAAALDDAIKIQVRQQDTGWTECARLNMLISAPSGTSKTPALSAATCPLKDIELQWREADDKKFAEWQDDDRKREAAAKHRDGEIRKYGPHTSVAQNPLPECPQRPKRRRLVLNDTTSEGVCAVLRDNPRGILLEVDEATGWIASFDAYRNGASGKDRAFWLQTDNGGPYAKDRADEANSIRVPNLSVSIVGGIQPDKLAKLAGELIDDGLLQRAFIIAASPRRLRPVDRAPNSGAEAAYQEVLRRLLDFRPAVPPKAVQLDREAHRYRMEIEALVDAYKELPTTPGPLRNHLGKWPGRFARLLLTFHAIECAGGLSYTVAGSTAKRLRDFMVHYLLPQQLRFYTAHFGAAAAGMEDARWIAGYILAQESERVTLRDIKRGMHADDRRVMAAMEILNEAAWVGEPEHGNRSVSWPINPRVHALFAERAKWEKAERAETQRAIQEAAARVRRYR